MTRSSEIISELQKSEPEMLAFLERVVNQDSPSTSKELCDRVGELFSEKAREVGFETSFEPQAGFGNNLVARYGGRSGEGVMRVLLIGHMDTVFENDTTLERPYRQAGNRAFGPGVLDMKAGLIIGLYAVRTALTLTEHWHVPLTFVFNTDEEPGSPCSRTLIEEEATDHDLALILEPGTEGPAVTVARKGVGIFTLRTTGRAAHAGVEPERGVNSILDIANRVVKATTLADSTLGTTINVGVIAGGTQPYVVPSECSCQIDVRVTSLTEQKRVEAGLQAIADGDGVEGALCALEGSFHRPPFETSEASESFISRLLEASKDVGYPLMTGKSGGASDGNLTSHLGVPTIDGLGAHGGFAHGVDEYIEVESIVNKAAVLCAFLMDLNSAESHVHGDMVGR